MHSFCLKSIALEIVGIHPRACGLSETTRLILIAHSCNSL